MKKALIVTTIGGFLPQFEMNDVKILKEYGYEIHYASDFSNPVYDIDMPALEREGIVLHNIDIRKSPKHLVHNFRAYKQVKKIIQEEKIELVHCHNPIGSVVARFAAHKSGVHPYVMYTAHGFHFYKGAPLKNWIFYYTVEKIMAHFTDCIITINREDYLRSTKMKLRKPGKTAQINSVGINLDKFKPVPEVRDEVRKNLGIPKGGFHIVTAAELNENKNQQIIIKAIEEIDNPNIYFTICGKGPLEQKLRQMIVEKHLEKQVKLMGFRNDINVILQSADCFAFPSHREGLGMAAVEALATGIPVIAAENRGTREYIKDGINGIFCDNDNVKTYINAIKKMQDIDYRTELAGNARKSIAKFSITETDKKMRKIYRG